MTLDSSSNQSFAGTISYWFCPILPDDVIRRSLTNFWWFIFSSYPWLKCMIYSNAFCHLLWSVLRWICIVFCRPSIFNSWRACSGNTNEMTDVTILRHNRYVPNLYTVSWWSLHDEWGNMLCCNCWTIGCWDESVTWFPPNYCFGKEFGQFEHQCDWILHCAIYTDRASSLMPIILVIIRYYYFLNL